MDRSRFWFLPYGSYVAEFSQNQTFATGHQTKRVTKITRQNIGGTSSQHRKYNLSNDWNKLMKIKELNRTANEFSKTVKPLGFQILSLLFLNLKDYTRAILCCDLAIKTMFSSETIRLR